MGDVKTLVLVVQLMWVLKLELMELKQAQKVEAAEVAVLHGM